MGGMQNEANSNVTSPTSAESLFKKEQAVVIEARDGIALKDYALAVTRKIGSENLMFISKISDNQICATLSSKNLVDRIISENNTIEINEHQLNISPLTTQGQRIVFSNVCPWIPDSVLVESLMNYGIRMESDISCLKADLNVPELSHVASHRRQAFINSDDVRKIPEGGILRVKRDGLTYNVHVAAESMDAELPLGTDNDERNNQNFLENTNADGARGFTKIKLERSEFSFTVDTESTS